MLLGRVLDLQGLRPVSRCTLPSHEVTSIDTRTGVGCRAVDDYQAILGTTLVREDEEDQIAARLGQDPNAHEPGAKPAPPEHCTGQFGNSDAFVSRVTP